MKRVAGIYPGYIGKHDAIARQVNCLICNGHLNFKFN
jgi:hypothetical protein